MSCAVDCYCCEMDGLLETGKARGLHAMGLNEHTDIEQRDQRPMSVCLSFCLSHVFTTTN